MLRQVLGSTHVQVQQQVLALLLGRPEPLPVQCCQAVLLLMLCLVLESRHVQVQQQLVLLPGWRVPLPCCQAVLLLML